MLNSLLRGGVEQLAKSRDTYVKACEKAGRSAAEVASLLGRWGVSRHVYVAPTDAQALAEAKDAEMWYQESLRRFLVPERIDRVRPRGHAAVPLSGGPSHEFHRHFARLSTNPIAFVKAPTVNGFWSSGPSLGASTDALSLR